jgi:phosphoribosylglycinamide formyltransferase 1
MKHVSVWASGNGSNAENLVNHFSRHPHICIDHILSNNPEAGVIERARKLSVECFVFSRKDFREGTTILNKLLEHKTDYIVLSGFLQMVPSEIIRRFPEAIINIHPALLPGFGGKGMFGHYVHEAVLASGNKESGITVHVVDEIYDHGKTILQKRCSVLPDDTPDILAARVHELEYKWFPVAVEEYILNR